MKQNNCLFLVVLLHFSCGSDSSKSSGRWKGSAETNPNQSSKTEDVKIESTDKSVQPIEKQQSSDVDQLDDMVEDIVEKCNLDDSESNVVKLFLKDGDVSLLGEELSDEIEECIIKSNDNANESLPEIDENPEDLRGYTHQLVLPYTGGVMSCDSVWQDKFVFPGLGPNYGEHFLFVWDDGNELHVPNSNQMIMDIRQEDYRKFQPGGKYSNNNPDIPSMEIYAARGTHPQSVTLYYNKP